MSQDRDGWARRAQLARASAAICATALAVVIALYLANDAGLRFEHAHWAIPLLAACTVGMVGLWRYARDRADR